MKRTILLIAVFLSLIIKLKSQEISSYLVGTNLWYTNPSSTVWNLTKQGGFQTIRIGGASYDKTMPSNATILSWVKQIRAIGAEPIVQVSQYKSAAEAASLVKYLNVDKSGEIAPIKFWNVGNEPWLQNYSLAGGVDVGGMVETYFKPISAAMKEIDPTIKIYGPDFCYYVDFAMNDLFGGKNNIAGKIPGKDYYYCDGISWHSYPQTAKIDLAFQGLESFNSSIVKCKQRVDAANSAMNRTGDDALGWGIGEFNAKGGAENHTWGNGQMYGGIMGLCMKYGATYATTWSMFENGGNRTGTDFSMIDGSHMIPRASYRHMEFASKYFKGEYIDGTSTSNNFVVYGAKNAEQISVMIMHRGYGNPKEYTLNLNNLTGSGTAVSLKLKADTALTYSDMITERTTHVIIFRGDSIIKINYSSDDFDKEIAPQLSTVKIATQLPVAPSDFAVSPKSYNSTSLNWTDKSDNETGYIIEREISGVFQPIGMTSANAVSYSDLGLIPETTYKYRVATYNSMGKSDYSTIETVTTLATPAAIAYKGPHAIPGRTEAEDFNNNGEGLSFHDNEAANQGGAYRTTAVDVQASTDTGLGYNVGYIVDGEWLTYLIESVTPGTYDIALRTASATTTTTARRIDVYIDNVKVGQVTPSITGGWQTWETKYIKNIELKDDQPKLLKLLFVGGNFNINWIEFGKDLSTSIRENSGNSLISYYDKANQLIHVQLTEELKKANVQVFNSLGQSIFSRNLTEPNSIRISASDWPKGIYLVSVSNQKIHYTSKLIVY